MRALADPTFLHSDFTRQPVYDLLKRFKTINYKGDIFTDFLGSGWSWSDYRQYYMAQRSDFPMYGNVVTFSLKEKNAIDISPSYFRKNIESAGSIDSGFAVDKPWDTNRFYVSNGAGKKDKTPYNPTIGTILELLGRYPKGKYRYRFFRIISLFTISSSLSRQQIHC